MSKYWETDRLLLRPVVEEDWELDARSREDSEGRFFLYREIEPPLTEEGVQSRWAETMAYYESEDRLALAICLRETGTPIGTLSLVPRDVRNGSFTMPVQILPEYRGMGYAEEAMHLLLGYAFRELRLHKLCVSILEGNRASIALHERLGCVPEGRFREAVWHDGHWIDEFWYGLTAAEFCSLSN